MVAPIDFTIDVQNPVKLAMQGFQQGLALNQAAQNIQKQKDDQARALSMRQDLAEFSQMPNLQTEDYARIMTKYPELSEKFKSSYNLLNDQQKQSSINQISQVYAALEGQDLETAKELLEEQKEAAQNAGLTDDARKADIMLKQIEINPNAAKISARMALSSIMGADKFAETFKTLLPKTDKAFRPLSSTEKKNLGLDPNKSFQIGTDGKISAIGGGGVQVNIGDKGKIGPIPAGYQVKENEKGELVMSPIKGGPVYLAAIEGAKKTEQTQELAGRAGQVVIDSIDRLKTQIKDAPWYNPVAGTISAKLLPNIRQNRVDAEQTRQAIVSNIGFDRLQQMRDASPTGGALGQVSERELSTLQAVLGSLDLSQSPEQLTSNLDRLKKIYEPILEKAQAYPNADEFGFSSQDSQSEDEESPEVIRLEAKLNRKLTAEEKAYLISKGGS